MVALAKLIFTIALINQGDIVVTWFFQEKGCHACHENQIQIMTRFYRTGDRIILLTQKGTDWPEGFKLVLKEQLGATKFFVNPSDEELTSSTGYRLVDTMSGEVFSYHSSKGVYHLGRAQLILATFRNEKSVE